MYVLSHERFSNKHMAMTAWYIVDVVPNRLFRLLVANFSGGTIIILKEMMIYPAAGVQGELVGLSTTPEIDKDTTTVHLMHYKPAVIREVHMETAHDVAQEEDDRPLDTWQESITISNEYRAYCWPILDMLQRFSYIWDGHLGRINVAKNQIHVTSPEVRLIHSAHYIVSTKARLFEK